MVFLVRPAQHLHVLVIVMIRGYVRMVTAIALRATVVMTVPSDLALKIATIEAIALKAYASAVMTILVTTVAIFVVTLIVVAMVNVRQEYATVELAMRVKIAVLR